jgi:hypothetical protein
MEGIQRPKGSIVMRSKANKAFRLRTYHRSMWRRLRKKGIIDYRSFHSRENCFIVVRYFYTDQLQRLLDGSHKHLPEQYLEAIDTELMERIILKVERLELP